MDVVIQQIELALERSDSDIKNNRLTVEEAETSLMRAQERLDQAVEKYNHAVSFKEEAIRALAVLRAYEE